MAWVKGSYCCRKGPSNGEHFLVPTWQLITLLNSSSRDLSPLLYQKCTRYTYMHASKTLLHIKIKLKKKVPDEC